MNKGTKIRTALAIAMAFYVALYKVDVTDFGNDIVNLVYQILMKLATFVVIFLVTYFNQDYTEAGAIGTGVTRQIKKELEDSYIGDRFFTEAIKEVEDTDEHEDNQTA